MKSSSALAWTKKQRSQLAGLRVHHKNDPPPCDHAAQGWARIRGWIEACSALPDATKDAALRAAIAEVRAEITPPDRCRPQKEALRLMLAEVGIALKKKWYYNEPFFAEAFADVWASLDFISALTLPSESPHFVVTHGQIGVEEVVPPSQSAWLNHPWQLGGRGLNVGYAYFSALRRRVFAMPDETFKKAFPLASDLRAKVLASDRADRMTMLYVLAFVFSRDGEWAREHAEAIVETPKLGTFVGWDLLVPSLTDSALSLALLRQNTHWVSQYCHNLPLVFDIVEALGSDATPVLRAIHTAGSKPRVKKPIDEAIALSRS